MRADFSYNIPGWKPKVVYERSGGRGTLTIEQPNSHHTNLGNTKYEWDLQLNNKVPMDLRANFGAGDARLDLGSLDLRSVQVDMGVGKLTMDLHGKPKQDYDVRVNGGVGEATIRLPSDVGVWAEATGGIGAIDASGLRKEGGHWETDALGKSKVKIRLEVHGGIGSVHLIAD
jgi:predicted membrane protein